MPSPSPTGACSWSAGGTAPGPASGRYRAAGSRRGVLAEAVVRELVEETGLEGVCGPFLGWVERIGADHHHVILDFRVTILDPGNPVAGDDAVEVAWVPVGDVADLRLVTGLAEFLHDHDLIPTIA